MKLICISCPVGCRMNVEKDENGEIKVTGNSCKRGVKYAIDEFTDPKRMVTTSVRVDGGIYPMVSVKTSKPIKKAEVNRLLSKLKQIKVKAPIEIGDVILADIAGSDAAVVATRRVNML
jgi:CxxC motif-containing protein